MFRPKRHTPRPTITGTGRGGQGAVALAALDEGQRVAAELEALWAPAPRAR